MKVLKHGLITGQFPKTSQSFKVKAACSIKCGNSSQPMLVNIFGGLFVFGYNKSQYFITLKYKLAAYNKYNKGEICLIKKFNINVTFMKKKVLTILQVCFRFQNQYSNSTFKINLIFIVESFMATTDNFNDSFENCTETDPNTGK